MSDDTSNGAPKKKKGGMVKKLIFFVFLPVLLIGGGIGAGVYAAGAGMIGHGNAKRVDPNRPKLVVK